jgi:putative phosphoribosyl transferase
VRLGRVIVLRSLQPFRQEKPVVDDTSVGESPPLWPDRHAAGVALAGVRADLRPPALLLALPRGGVAVAAAMADQLRLPLATWSVRKVSDPANPELAIGAVAPGGVVVWRPDGDGRRHEAAARRFGWLAEQQRELARRQVQFGDPPAQALRNRELVVVDDGIATGMTLRAALLSLRRLQPASLQLAVPVADREALAGLSPLLDRITVLAAVPDLLAVGHWYRRFEQLSDGEVLALLAPRR